MGQLFESNDSDNEDSENDDDEDKEDNEEMAEFVDDENIFTDESGRTFYIDAEGGVYR